MFRREEGDHEGREGGREGELYKAHMLFLPIEKLHIVRAERRQAEERNVKRVPIKKCSFDGLSSASN